jgi:hypothetical protein
MKTKHNKLILGIYDDPDKVLDATRKVRKSGYDIKDVYTPFPIHGIDRAMGVKRSRLGIAAFMFAMLGLLSAVALQVYVSYGDDWMINIGGKPNLHIPTYIPVSFELSILFTAFGMVATFFVVARMAHGKNVDLMDPRQTDDRIVIAVNLHNDSDNKPISDILISHGALEVREREVSL